MFCQSRNSRDEGSSAAAQSPSGLTPPTDALYWTQYPVWYPIFRKHAPKSSLINISTTQPEFVRWMETDSITLPVGSGPSTAPPKISSIPSPSASVASDESDSDDDDDEDEEEPVRLEQLDSAIRKVLEKYDGGPVFPKLNWSAPQDAAFMLAGNALQCRHPEDVYLVLKSSEFASRDIEQLQHLASAPASSHLQLVLKQWASFNRSYEFRVFVRENLLIAISQRDATFYPHLQPVSLQEELCDQIYDFWYDVVRPLSRPASSLANGDGNKESRPKFPLKDYVMDVYISKDRSRVWIVDFNPWLPRTDPLLFDYDELESISRESLLRPPSPEEDPNEDEDSLLRLAISSPAQPPQTSGESSQDPRPRPWCEEDVVFRVLDDQRMQSNSATYSSNMVPHDLVDFAKATTSAGGNPGSQGLSVDQVVEQWNKTILAQEAQQEQDFVQISISVRGCQSQEASCRTAPDASVLM
ncbi:D123-domain-containing protein [Testicularia cyperi]|uniref:D123-domain-containing protein n=1 Tax=Testicularia cyperi TaxID=1882483 RepID=A0A317XFZ6_9BASI|nr:D123-domain-containing protein [Testicularia cyperi]